MNAQWVLPGYNMWQDLAHASFWVIHISRSSHLTVFPLYSFIVFIVCLGTESRGAQEVPQQCSGMQSCSLIPLPFPWTRLLELSWAAFEYHPPKEAVIQDHSKLTGGNYLLFLCLLRWVCMWAWTNKPSLYLDTDGHGRAWWDTCLRVQAWDPTLCLPTLP